MPYSEGLPEVSGNKGTREQGNKEKYCKDFDSG